MSDATDELRRMLDKNGVSYESGGDWFTTWSSHGTVFWEASEYRGYIEITGTHLTPAQAVEATMGRGTCRKVYLVETSDELIGGWFPFGVYLHREAAEDCAEALRREDDGILCFARVSELEVVE